MVEMKTAGELSFLIVEDQPDQAMLTKAFVLMQFPKSKIIIAKGLKEAFEFLDKVKPNAVILDMHLGDGEGSELLKVYKEERGYPILVLTGDKSENVLSEMMELGADDFIFKPIDELIFQSKLRSLISGRYMSPLTFLGNRAGLGTIEFSSDIKVTYIDDSVVKFQAKFSLVKECLVNFVVEGMSLELRIKSSLANPLDPNVYNLEAEFENVTTEGAQKIRQFIFQKNGERLSLHG